MIFSVYEFIVGSKVWEVFSTKEWEKFALIFHKRSVENVDRTRVEGLRFSSIPMQNDGRRRIQVGLPDLDWVLLNLPKGRPTLFPIKKMLGEYHVPQYLTFSASLLDANTGSTLKDEFDHMICSSFGSAKLACISKTERKFTVIVYGINMIQ